MSADRPDLAHFLRAEIDPATFPHREHVRMAFEMLKRHDFPETVLHFSRTLRAMAHKVGRPEAFHQTVTIAFLSLIAERMGSGGTADFAAFAAANPDLLDKTVLARWYSAGRLASAAARRTFLLPDSAPHGARPPEQPPAAARSGEQAEAE